MNLKNKIIIAITVAIVFVAFTETYPYIMMVMAAAALAAWVKKRPEPAVLVLTCALAGGLAGWYWVKLGQDFWTALKPDKYPRQEYVIDMGSWFTREPLDNLNNAGRIGVLFGALAGVALSWLILDRGTIKKLHGPGIVQGKPVAVEGDGWADEKALADLAEYGPPRPDSKFGGGIVLGRLEGRIVRLPVGRQGMACHTIAFGATGAGKTFGFVLPNIVSAVYEGSSVVVSDPKGELLAGKYNRLGQYEPGIAEWLQKQGYKVVVLNFKNPRQGSHRWNPLMEANSEGEFRQVCEAMIMSAGKENPFFAGGETNLFTALMGLTKYNSRFTDEQRHMRTVLSLLSWPVEALDREFEREYREGRLPFFFYEKWKTSKPVLGNFATGVANKVAVMTDGALAAVTAGHDIDLLEMAQKKVALFCVLPTQGDLRPLLTAFYFLLFKRLIDFAEKNHNRLPVPVKFVLDEFANIGRIPDFEKRIAFDRGLGITYICIMQALTQFTDLYGSSEAHTILANADIRLCLRANDLKTASYFADMLGEARVWDVKQRKDITTPMDRLELTKKTRALVKERLMYPWQMLELPFYTAVARIPTTKPLYLTTVAFDSLKEYKELPKEEKAIGNYAPPVPDRVPVPEVPVEEEEEEEKPDREQKRKRKRSENKGGIDIDELFGEGDPD